MDRVIKSGNFTMGIEVSSFEREFSEYFGSRHSVMANSGSSANLLALSAIRYSSLNPENGRNEVIVPAVSWSTTYYPITQNGWKLRFIDVDLFSLNSSLQQFEAAVGPRTAGIVAVNLLGNPCDLPALRSLADSSGLFLVEDNCESLGAKINGQFAGTFGHVGTFSTFFSHHISTMEGGLAVTNSDELQQIMLSLRAHGWTRELPDKNFVSNKSGNAFEDSYKFALPGYNLRPLDMEGAIGREQLHKIHGIVEGRRANALRFKELMENYPKILTQAELGASSWFGFSMILREEWRGHRDLLCSVLEEFSIASRPIVAGNFTRNPVINLLEHAPIGDLPNADIVHSDGLFIGNHHYPMHDEFVLLQEAIEAFEYKLTKVQG